MGLDSYAYYRLPNSLSVLKEFHYWRKHYPIHDWMETLWRSKGNTEEFNCVCVDITSADIDALELCINQDSFYNSTESYNIKYHRNDDLQFIVNARNYLKAGLEIVYDSWW